MLQMSYRFLGNSITCLRCQDWLPLMFMDRLPNTTSPPLAWDKGFRSWNNMQEPVWPAAGRCLHTPRFFCLSELSEQQGDTRIRHVADGGFGNKGRLVSVFGFFYCFFWRVCINTLVYAHFVCVCVWVCQLYEGPRYQHAAITVLLGKLSVKCSFIEAVSYQH